MKYTGEDVISCVNYDFFMTALVVVSGDKFNPCGHALLNLGGITGSYFHVANWHDKPKYMDYSGYSRYLLENGKHEISWQIVDIPHPLKASEKLDELMNQKWIWAILPNNCINFVEEVFWAGGADGGSISNCPSLERF